ncbi:hypothetical protein MCOR27_001469 [Pyricularia oryzae]|uniref:DNA repair protein RAD51 homolog 3 n=2 Tax=Pyricularia TaxID=48558 RepID=A0ABQ8NZT1_PYRGI|nr:hypothetical protein MCOR01_010351 [Pyricularia oryzae]KAI6303195.1 hypothetical protein MCOR33_001642 [Pyricularia grisea]KAI6262334.1 hypothetical protein MCOR19_001525 [Pyricularia oryzae]KAI6266626.1 hypothetical protein MCOR26_010092 [Pyricularia oryzae]KAI6287295.1 hypothetical protein MCOR27_001469 [Pyricularia oryzae]
MDYHQVHGKDISSFDLPSTHRLPTVSAAQAQEELTADPFRFVSTGLDVLDTLLAASKNDGRTRDLGGVQRGIVTEIWGPPGIGKTSLGLQLASNALASKRSVVWVDCFHSVCSHRLPDIIDTKHEPDVLDMFVHFECPELAHLIALLCRPNELCVPLDTSLVVVDSLTALINHAYPRTFDGRAAAKMSGGSKIPSSSAKRQQTIQHLIGALQKLAATRNLAVVILSQCATKMQLERGAALIPAVNASWWEDGISTRIVLFRDWSMQSGSARAARFAAALKVNGKKVDEGDIELAAFETVATGLEAVALDSSRQSQPRQKRELGPSGTLEIPDSDDEDYGWQEEDASALPQIPQWQGSEDILLVRGQDSDEGEELEPTEEGQNAEFDK